MRYKMKVVSFPDKLKNSLIKNFANMLDEGQVAEGKFYSAEDDYITSKKSVPVATWGAAYVTLLSYYKNVENRNSVILQNNTMRGVYTASRFMSMEVQVCNSSTYPGFLAMDFNSFSNLVVELEEKKKIDDFILVYSVIGGFLSNDYFKIEELCKSKKIPIIVDMAHAHYLNEIIETDYADLAFSFYATKILPSGEGGLITVNNDEKFSWIKKFLIYDRFDYSLEVGVNFRTNELTSFFIHKLMTDKELINYYKDRRINIALKFREECLDKKINFLDYEKAKDYNGYKFVILDSFEESIKKSDLFNKLGKTSPVFNYDIVNKKSLLPHWCPPTYPSLNF